MSHLFARWLQITSDERRKRNEQSGMIQVAGSALPEELRGQTCIPAAVLQLQLTSIRPPPASLPNRFLLSLHATPTNYGRLTQNRLNCDLKLGFIFLCVKNVCVCVWKGVGGGVAVGCLSRWAEVDREHFNHQFCLSDANWLSLSTMCLI